MAIPPARETPTLLWITWATHQAVGTSPASQSGLRGPDCRRGQERQTDDQRGELATRPREKACWWTSVWWRRQSSTRLHNHRSGYHGRIADTQPEQ